MRITLLILTTLFIVGCATTQMNSTRTAFTEPLRPIKVEPQAKAVFNRAERLFKNGEYDVAKKYYEQIKKNYPTSNAHKLSSYRIGAIHYLKGDFGAASREFAEFLNKNPNSELNFDITYNYAASEFQLKRYDKASQLLSKLSPEVIESQGSRRAAVVYHLMGLSAINQNQSGKAALAFANEWHFTNDAKIRSGLTQRIDELLAEVKTPEEIQNLAFQVRDPEMKNHFDIATSNLRPSSIASSATPSQETPAGNVGLPYPNVALNSGDGYRIGVVLPLSGKFSVYGRKALDAILLASGVYRGVYSNQFHLVVEDTASNPAIAKKAIERLRAENVSAIIGPLQWKESVAAIEQMQGANIPIIPLTAKEGIANMNSNVFQNALSPRVQMENLARFCIEERKLKKFAILAPADDLGRDMSTEFQNAIQKLGGEIVTQKAYSPTETDFLLPIQQLMTEDRPNLRRLSPEKLAALIDQSRDTASNITRAELLGPSSEFEAILVPDSPKNLGGIAASLAYFDLNNVVLLGTTEWNSDELFSRGGKNIEGALFPGGIHAQTKNPKQRDFILDYREAFGNNPDLLAAQAFEAFELVHIAISKSGSRNASLINEILSLNNVDTVLGRASFDGTRTAKHILPIFSVRANSIFIQP